MLNLYLLIFFIAPLVGIGELYGSLFIQNPHDLDHMCTYIELLHKEGISEFDKFWSLFFFDE